MIATGALSAGGDPWQVAESASHAPLTVKGGGRFEVGGGFLWQSPQYPVASSLTINYHFDRSAGVNTEARFGRVPVENMLYYTGLETVRFGAGVSGILSPTVKVLVDGAWQSVEFKNALGKSFEIGYRIAPALWANLRLSSAKYKPKSAGVAQAADVSMISVNLSRVF